MVRAILDGRKTETRRVARLVREGETGGGVSWEPDAGKGWGRARSGDRLWVRETWRIAGGSGVEAERYGLRHGLYTRDEILYRADASPDEAEDERCGWRPSIYMPRWASRLTLEVIGVRAEQLRRIGMADVLAEGVGRVGDGPEELRAAFARGWDRLNGKRAPWDSDPSVWVLTFRRIG